MTTDTLAGDETPDVEVKPRKGVVSFSRQVKVRDYENANAFMSLEFPIDWDDEAEHIVEKAREGMTQAKALVYEQLGLDAQLNENGILVEIVKDAFPGAQRVQADEHPTANAVDAEPPYDVDTQDKAEKQANQDWADARFRTHPNEFYDNRGNKRNPRAPDAKHKRTQLPLWKVS